MGRAGSEESTALAESRIPEPPSFGQLTMEEQSLLTRLLAGDPSGSAEEPGLAPLIVSILSENEIELEWRHWTQHLLGTVKMRLMDGEIEEANKLAEHYWPKALAYRELANPASTTEKELLAAAVAGGVTAETLLEHRRQLIFSLVTLDKERALRVARQQPLSDLVKALAAGDAEGAASALERIKSSGDIDAAAFAWASAVHSLL